MIVDSRSGRHLPICWTATVLLGTSAIVDVRSTCRRQEPGGSVILSAPVQFGINDTTFPARFWRHHIRPFSGTPTNSWQAGRDLFSSLGRFRRHNECHGRCQEQAQVMQRSGRSRPCYAGRTDGHALGHGFRPCNTLNAIGLFGCSSASMEAKGAATQMKQPFAIISRAMHRLHFSDEISCNVAAKARRRCPDSANTRRDAQRR